MTILTINFSLDWRFFRSWFLTKSFAMTKCDPPTISEKDGSDSHPAIKSSVSILFSGLALVVSCCGKRCPDGWQTFKLTDIPFLFVEPIRTFLISTNYFSLSTYIFFTLYLMFVSVKVLAFLLATLTYIALSAFFLFVSSTSKASH